jgi:hypothetical protein
MNLTRLHQMKTSKSIIFAISTTALALMPCSLRGQQESNLLKTVQEASAGAIGTAVNAVSAQTQPATGADADLATAIETLKLQIEQSMQTFSKASMPDEEKLKLFDKSLADLDMLLDQTKEGGPLDSLIQKSYAENKQRLDLIKQRATDTSIPAEMRAGYESRKSAFEKTIEATGEKRLVLIRTRNDLAKRRDLVEKNKQFYLDMMSFDDLEAANKTLDNVIASMNNLNEVIDKLGAGLIQPAGGGPAVR